MPNTRRACLLAALLSAAAVCGGDAVARVFPFGPRHRAVNDLANQFTPFHAHLWDLLRGRADGGLLLDWRAGWGTAFLPDYGTYLSSPFAPLVALFPRGDVEYAVYAITVLKTAVAAAAMTFLLRRLGPGAWWWAAVLGASYALCGWSLAEGTYNPMWLDGLIALPLLCLVGEWVREGRRPLLGPLVVAVCWTANFYTAYMATLGAALVLLVRLAATGSFRGRTLARAAVTTGIGVGLAAPLLLPVLLGSRHAHPGLVREFAPVAGTDFLARLLPVTYGFATPAAFVCTAVLLLAGALPFRRDVPGRERWLWPGLCAAVAASMQWGPTHLLWHAFATPNGSPYRQTFVLSGVLVLTAWTTLTHGRPGRRAVAGGSAVVLALALAALPSPVLTSWALVLAGAGLAAVAAALLLPRRGRYGVLAALLVAGTLLGQASATTAYADRERLARLDDYPPLGAEQERRAAAMAAADGWPAYRTDPGLPRVAGNDPLLLGGQGAAYYSSHTPAVLTATLTALGGGWTSRGRNLLGPDNPVTDALSGVGARWRDGAVVRTDVFLPLVTVRPPGPPPAYGPSPFRNQELLLGSRVYEAPHAGACRVGTEVFLWAPDATGPARLGDREVRLLGGRPKRQAAMVSLGLQRTPGLRPVLPGPGELGCLDHARLRAAVTALRARAATSVEVTPSGVRAVLPPGGGTAVVAVPRTAGWRCEGAGARAYGGFLAVPLGAGRTELACSFRPPGLRAGLAAGAVAGLALLFRVRPGSFLRRRRTSAG
ncbi:MULTISPECIES: YfhO family protein [unclassified Streptomyces]|uniref:YfhO family protein n=1 Tax=unclassified Streptomyces TaxID=2593676 RepID=UPI0006AFBC67|nr:MULTISPECIES: YfhO family protein [unclassified Streptomyces]KOX18119.1 membrane protein [Streptomyces sp. NRRL F-6491]KOX37714.1 membrane protein [Streptomyces sp. NRRL F-6492]